VRPSPAAVDRHAAPQRQAPGAPANDAGLAAVVPAPPRPAEPAAQAPPAVEVHIGTIEVRAAPADAPSAPAPTPAFEGFAAYAGMRSYAQAVRA
jgi:hypothetical protein